MKHVVLAAFLVASLAAMAPTVAARTPPPRLQPQVVTTFVDGDLVIGTSGEVASYRVTTPLDGGMATRIEELVGRLRFEPVEVDGRPVRASTHMRVTLIGTPQADGGMRVGIDNITFPDETVDKGANGSGDGVRMEVTRKFSPGYPTSALQGQVGADVLVAVRVGLDGRIQEAVVRQSALLDIRGSDRVLTALLAEFERSSVQAIKGWRVKVDVAPGVTPTPEQLSGVITVAYRVKGEADRAAGRWTWETRSDKRPEPWLQFVPGASVVGISDVAPGSPLMRGVAPRYRLAAPLQGGAL